MSQESESKARLDRTGSNLDQQDQHFAPNFGSSTQNQKPIRFRTSDFRLQIPSFRLQLPDFQISDSRLQTPHSTRSIDHGSSGPLFRHRIRQKYYFEETGMESRKLCTRALRLQATDPKAAFRIQTPDSRLHVADFTFTIPDSRLNTSESSLPI